MPPWYLEMNMTHMQYSTIGELVVCVFGVHLGKNQLQTVKAREVRSHCLVVICDTSPGLSDASHPQGNWAMAPATCTSNE